VHPRFPRQALRTRPAGARTDKVEGERRVEQPQRQVQQRVLHARRLRGRQAVQLDAARRHLVQHAQRNLKGGEERVVAEGDRDLALLRQRPVAVLDVHLCDELVQDAHADDAVTDRRLQELLGLRDDVADRRAVRVEPGVLGDPAQQLHDGRDGEGLQRGALVGEESEQVVADVHVLRLAEGVPVVCRGAGGR
jgi:hypothetical protein